MRRLVAALAFIVAMGVLPVNGANIFVSTVVLPMSTRPGGEYNFSAVSVPTGVVGLSFTMDITEAADPLVSIAASLEGSVDGGVTWIGAGGFSRPAAGKGVDKSGATNTVVAGTFTGGPFWNDSENPNRRLRGGATIGGTMRFAMTVQPL